MPKTALRGGERRVSPRFRAVAQEHDAPTQEAEARQPACGAQERRESPAGVMSTMSTGAQRVQDAMLPHAERADHNQRPFGGDPAKVSIRRDAGSNRKTRIIVAPVVLRRCPHPRRRQLAAVAPRIRCPRGRAQCCAPPVWWSARRSGRDVGHRHHLGHTRAHTFSRLPQRCHRSFRQRSSS